MMREDSAVAETASRSTGPREEREGNAETAALLLHGLSGSVKEKLKTFECKQQPSVTLVLRSYNRQDLLLALTLALMLFLFLLLFLILLFLLICDCL